MIVVGATNVGVCSGVGSSPTPDNVTGIFVPLRPEVVARVSVAPTEAVVAGVNPMLIAADCPGLTSVKAVGGKIWNEGSPTSEAPVTETGRQPLFVTVTVSWDCTPTNGEPKFRVVGDTCSEGTAAAGPGALPRYFSRIAKSAASIFPSPLKSAFGL